MPLPDHVATTFEFKSGDAHAPSFKLYWLIEAGSLTDTNAQAFADAVKAHFSAEIADCLSSNDRFQNVRVRYTSGGTEVESVSSDIGTPGGLTSDTLPEHDTVVIRRKTGMAGRANRGRIFFPLVPESFSDLNGTLTGSGLDAYGAVATKMDQNFVSAGTGITVKPVQPVPSLNLFRDVKYTEVVSQIRTRKDRQRERKLTTFRPT